MTNERITTGLPEPQGRGEDPLYHFTRTYLLFLQGLFKQFPEGSWKWSPDVNGNSEILITDQIPVPKEEIERRPAIVTMRGPAQFANMTLDNMRTVNDRNGMKERTDLTTCTMSLNCIAKLGTEAQRIGWIVMSSIRNFKTMLQRAGFHKIGDELSIGPESSPGALVSPEVDAELAMVTVQSPFYFQWTARTTPLDAPNLRVIEQHMELVLSPPRQATIRPPSVRGMPIATIKT